MLKSIKVYFGDLIKKKEEKKTCYVSGKKTKPIESAIVERFFFNDISSRWNP